MAVGEPVAGIGGIERTVHRLEELLRLRGKANRLAALVEATQGLGQEPRHCRPKALLPEPLKPVGTFACGSFCLLEAACPHPQIGEAHPRSSAEQLVAELAIKLYARSVLALRGLGLPEKGEVKRPGDSQ